MEEDSLKKTFFEFIETEGCPAYVAAMKLGVPKRKVGIWLKEKVGRSFQQETESREYDPFDFLDSSYDPFNHL